MEFCWMNEARRFFVGGLPAGVLMLASSQGIAQPAGAAVLRVNLALLSAAQDPRLDASHLERAYLGHAGGSAADGLKLAIEDSSFELEAAKLSVQLQPTSVSSLEDAKVQALKLAKGGAVALVSELPAAWLSSVAGITDLASTAFLNTSETNDSLREQQCRANLFHVYPSERMRVDALAQVLVARRWSKVLLLAGDSELDRQRTEVVERTLKRFNLKMLAKKSFKLSADPRERKLANLGLLTAGHEFDVLWIVDSEGEFARSVPYRMPLPRPVVGDAGLVSLAWDPRFERFGAPQVSKAFAKKYRRTMTGHDWTAWLTGRLVVGALAQMRTETKKLSPLELMRILSAPDFKVDGSKGQTLSFRAWDRQLRQPMLLSDGQGVVEVAPIEGVMHPRSALDSLGADAPEKLCKVSA
jgi:ABC transporter substrate binding protein (PQQ-dependent alcohol dehydrogenase system)